MINTISKYTKEELINITDTISAILYAETPITDEKVVELEKAREFINRLSREII